MSINRGFTRPSPAPTGASRSNVTAPTGPDAGVARQTSSGLFGPLTRAATNPDIPSKGSKNKPDEGLSNDDNETAKSKAKKAKDTLFDGNSPDTKPSADDDKDKDKVTKDAGSGGDFKPMGGDDKNPWDANADKGENPAPNSTGAPDTPSGL